MKFQIIKQQINIKNSKIGFRLLIAIILAAGLGVYDYIVIQEAKNKVEQIAEKEMPLLIAEKGLSAAVAASQEAVQGYLANGGDEFFKEQLQKQKAIISYHIDAAEKLNPSDELIFLHEKNKAWFTFVEKEIIAAESSAVAGSGNLETRAEQMIDIQAGYKEQIAVQEAVIQELEHEVMTAENATKILIVIMSLILVAAGVSGAVLRCKKYLTPKGVAEFSKTA